MVIDARRGVRRRTAAKAIAFVLLLTVLTGCSQPEESPGAGDGARHVDEGPPVPGTLGDSKGEPRNNATAETNTTQPPASEGEGPPAREAVVSPAVVVADIGPGANPYHEAFQRDWPYEPAEAIAGLPPYRTLRLAENGSHQYMMQADAPAWASYETHRLHWVEGTNLLLLTLRSYEPHAPSIRDGHSNGTHHGAMTAGAVSAACPSCYVLAVQDWNNLDGGALGYIADELPWVDAVTGTSFAFGNEEYVASLQSSDWPDNAFRLREQGIPVFAPTGNAGVTPVMNPLAPALLHNQALPPWVVAVSGAHSECGAISPEAGKPADFVGNFTQRLPGGDTVSEWLWADGTSFATPAVAGAFGTALDIWRQADPDAWTPENRADSMETLLAAMQAAALHFPVETYVAPPACPVGAPSHGGAVPAPLVGAAWAQVGWGYMGPAQARAAVEAVLSGNHLADRDPGTEAGMRAWRDLRSALYPTP